MHTKTLTLFLVVAVSGCGLSDPSHLADGGAVLPDGGGGATSAADVQAARARLEAATEAAHQARTALELLGLLPVYTCGEATSTFVGRAVAGAQVKVACATVMASTEPGFDVVTLALGTTGCAVNGKTVTGDVRFRFATGSNRFDAELDLTQAQVDGAAVPARAGYTVCGDEDKAWAKAEGTLPNRPGTTFKLDGSLAKRAGAPLVGSTSFVLDGTGELSSAGGVDRITFTALEYEPGAYLPRSGVVLIETAGGRRFRARFLPVFWKLGKAEVTVDSNAPVEVPIVQ